jgi:PAS domain S-box-containing protein
MKPQDFVRGQDKLEVQSAVEEAMLKGEAFVRAEFITKDGRQIPHLFTGRRTLIGGKPCLLGTGIDVTELRQMEEALRESEARYRNIVETALEGVWVLDTEGRTSYVNHRMAEMLGYKPDEMLGQHLFDFMDDEGRRLAEVMWQERQQGFGDIHEFCFLRQDGAPLWAIVSARPLVSDTGGFLGAFAMLTDITARKQVEEALRESETEYRLLVNNIPAVVARGLHGLVGGRLR